MRLRSRPSSAGGSPRTRFIVEPGPFLVGPAGVYVGAVRSVKQSRGTRFVVLDGGMNHHLAASGNLGQVIKRDYPVVNALTPAAAQPARPTLVGPLCTPLDTLAPQGAIAAARGPATSSRCCNRARMA